MDYASKLSRRHISKMIIIIRLFEVLQSYGQHNQYCSMKNIRDIYMQVKNSIQVAMPFMNYQTSDKLK